MGTFAKRLGQLAARSLESESSQILRSGAANKRGLSLALDGTLRKSHDMKVFGLGTLASLSSRERYSRFTASMHAVYSAMEGRLDASKSAPTQRLWSRFGPQLRRTEALAADLDEAIGADSASRVAVTPATASYVAAIVSAADDDDANDGARLVGHCTADTLRICSAARRSRRRRGSRSGSGRRARGTTPSTLASLAVGAP